MKKLILSVVAGLALAGAARATVIGVYNFNGDSLSASSVASGWDLSSMDLHGEAEVSAGVLNFNSGTGVKYVLFTITPPSAADVSYSVTFNYNTYGKNMYFLIDASGFAATDMYTTIYNTSSLTSSVTLTLLPSFSSSAPFEMLVYVVTVTGSSDGVQIDNIEITAVPEPVNVALILFGCTFAGIGAGRKFLKKKAA